MKFLFSIILFACSHLGFNQTQLIKNALIEVNPEWLNYELSNDFLSQGYTPSSEQSAVKHHLMMAEKYLVDKYQHNPKALRLLNTHKHYWQNELFPKNYKVSTRNPCFIDEHGELCAVANLMYSTGDSALANRIHQDENYAFVKSIKTPGTDAWIEKSGLTIEDLALIQPGYEAPLPKPQCGSGIDSTRKHFGHTTYSCGCKNDLPHGEWKVYNQWGQLRQKGSMVNGQKDGKWMTYNYNVQYSRKKQRIPDRSFILEENFKNGVRHGSYLLKNSKNEIYDQLYFNMGNIEGEFIKEEKQYQPFYKRNYTKLDSLNLYAFWEITETDSTCGLLRNNATIGVWKKYNRITGNLKTVEMYADTGAYGHPLNSAIGRYEFFNNGYDYNDLIYSKSYDENQSLITYNHYDSEFHKHGWQFVTSSYKHKRPRIEHYLNGKLDGMTYVLGASNKSLLLANIIGQGHQISDEKIPYAVLESHSYKNGKMNGVKTIYDRNTEYQTHFVDGIQEGPYYQIHEEDTLVMGSFHLGKKHGTWKALNEDRTKKYEQNYTNGVLHGHQLYYDEEAQLVKHFVFDQCTKVKIEEHIGYDGVMIYWSSICGSQKCEEKFYHYNGKVKTHKINNSSGVLRQEKHYNYEGELTKHGYIAQNDIEKALKSLKDSNAKFATWYDGWDKVDSIEFIYDDKSRKIKIFGKIGSRIEGQVYLNSKGTKVKKFETKVEY